VSRVEAEAMIMDARVLAGWIEAPEPEVEAEGVEDGDAEAQADDQTEAAGEQGDEASA